jgi:hypothetical protein
MKLLLLLLFCLFCSVNLDGLTVQSLIEALNHHPFWTIVFLGAIFGPTRVCIGK